MRPKLLLGLFLIMCSVSVQAFNATINVKSEPADAKIYFDGQLLGIGSASFRLYKAASFTLTVERAGYETKTFIFKYKGGYRHSKTHYEPYTRGQNNITVRLIKNDNYIEPETVSTSTTYTNSYRYIVINKKFDPDNAWSIASGMIQDYFENFETTPKQGSELKSRWQSDIVGPTKIRTRITMRREDSSELTFKIRIESQKSDNPHSYDLDDHDFQPWDRLLNKYQNLIPELERRLSEE